MLNLFKKNSKTAKILSVVPINNGRLIIEFVGGELKILDLKLLGADFSFYEYPDELIEFVHSNTQIGWTSGQSLSLKKIQKVAETASPEVLMNTMLRLGHKNQAPTNMHKSEHWYRVYIRPFNTANQFVLKEEVRQGFSEYGGSFSLRLDEIRQYNNWKQHFENANCSWAIAIIENEKDTHRQVIAKLIEQIRNRNIFYAEGI